MIIIISEMIVFLLCLIFPLNIISMNLKTTCDLVKFPRECQCQLNRHVIINETRLRCRQLTEIKTNYHWSKISYDRLIFETLNDNLTLYRFVFIDLIVRTLRIHVSNLFIQDHTFDHAYIGQLLITNARIDFQSNNQIFYDTKITNLYFKSIDFQNKISEWIFSNAKIYIFLIESSKFYGFINQNQQIISQIETKMKYDNFLEYEYFPFLNRTKLFQSIDESSSSSIESEQTVILNITSINYPIYITIYTIISSINTTNLTENYFPNNIKYEQVEEIELNFNEIHFLNANVFRYMKEFQGRLILHNNQIQSIDIRAFDHLVLLKNLSLARNFIQNLSSRHFQDLKQLNELDLSFNQLYQLDNNTFEYLINLERLYLNYNPLKFIHSNTFSNLIKLKEIHFHGIKFIHSIDQQYFQWIWNLASLHITDSLKTDFELSDVAFCILSRYNQTLFHLSRQHSCSCNIHYFNHNQNLTENTSILYETNYLRLTPICYENDENELILHNLENQCDYKLTFIDCNAMTTTTTTTTTTVQTTTVSKIETTENFDTSIQITTKNIVVSSTTSRSNIRILTVQKSLNNTKKLFTVLGTLVFITLCAIMLVFVWYRCKTITKQRKNKENFVEQRRHFNSPNFDNHPSTTLRYVSLDISSSEQISTTKSQSETLIEPSLSNFYKNLEINDNDIVQNFIDDENLQQNVTTVEM